MSRGKEIPSHHPVREMFHSLTERGLKQSQLSDREIHHYLSDLLVEFIHVENLYKVRDEAGRGLGYLIDMLEKAEKPGPMDKRDIYQHVGDFTLFALGLFPESLQYGKRCVSLNYYAEQGRRSYRIRWEMENYRSADTVFRKLSEQFEACVFTLNWVRNYIRDPFYQYMFREFDIV